MWVVLPNVTVCTEPFLPEHEKGDEHDEHDEHDEDDEDDGHDDGCHDETDESGEYESNGGDVLQISRLPRSLAFGIGIGIVLRVKHVDLIFPINCIWQKN